MISGDIARVEKDRCEFGVLPLSLFNGVSEAKLKKQRSAMF